jgi:hypothetical protein
MKAWCRINDGKVDKDFLEVALAVVGVHLHLDINEGILIKG